MAEKTSDYITKLAELLDAYPGAGFREVIRLIPDGLFVGTGLFALVTQNFPMAMLFLTMLETLLITVGLQNLAGYIALPETLPLTSSVSDACISGFQSPTLQFMSYFFKLPIKSSFPSPPVFVATTAFVYIISCMQQFTQELSELGPGFSTRFYVAMMLSFFSLFLIVAYRFVSQCDGAGILLLTILLGFALGIGLCQQNVTIFGKESINFLGIPVFKNRTAEGKPIYVCPTPSS